MLTQEIKVNERRKKKSPEVVMKRIIMARVLQVGTTYLVVKV